MGSNPFGYLGMGDGRSSSRKGKKSGSDKPKQPQRGLGVAQLEKIRLHSQMTAAYLPSLDHQLAPFHTKDNVMEFGSASSPSSCTYTATSPSLFAVHPSTMMGFGEANQRIGIRYVDQFQPSSSASSHVNHNGGYLHQYSAQQPVTLPLLQQSMEDSRQKKRRHDRRHSMDSMSQNSDSSDTQELDLELRLSL